MYFSPCVVLLTSTQLGEGVDVARAGAGTVLAGAGTVLAGAGTVLAGAGTVLAGAGTVLAGAGTVHNNITEEVTVEIFDWRRKTTIS
jgi:hypothetical protein